jgi:hypothetical protein
MVPIGTDILYLLVVAKRAKRDPPASTVGFFFAPNFIQNFDTVMKKRLWESRSTPTFRQTVCLVNIPESKLHYYKVVFTI